MASKRKRGDGWQVRWRGLDGREHGRLCPDAQTANALVRDIERTLALGRDWRPRDNAAAPALAVIMEAYLDDCERTCAPGTIYQRRISLEVLLRFLRTERPRGRLTPDLLSRDVVSAFWSWLRAARGNAALTAHAKVRHVEAFWRWARDSEKYGDDTPRPRRLQLADAAPALSPGAPTWAQCDAMIAALADVSRPWYRDLVVLLRYTGLRVGQAMQLEWRDVDLAAGLLTIRPELGKSRQERRGRIVPLCPHMVDELAGWGVREGFIVRAGGRRTPKYEPMRRAWAAAGRPQRQPFHALRKAFISELAARGVAERIIAALVGHGGGVTRDVYTSVAALMPAMREAVAKVSVVGEAAVEPLRRTGEQR